MTWYPWFEPLWQEWRGRLNSGRVPHALRLQGQAGWGLPLFAQHMATSLLCRQPDPQAFACGRCHDCRLIEQHNHPDYHWLQPDEKKSSLGIDAVRQWISQASQQPVLGRRRLFIMETADCLTLDATNALLKLLEEPGESVVFILLSYQPALLLPTLRSRCQELNMASLHADALAWLQQQPVPPDGLSYCLAGQAPLSLLLLPDAERHVRHKQFDLLLHLAQGHDTPWSWGQDDTASLLRLYDWLYQLVLDLLRLKLACPLNSLSMLGLALSETQAKTLAQAVSGAKLRQFMDELIQQSREQSQSLSLNTRMQIDRLLIQWFRLFRGHKI